MALEQPPILSQVLLENKFVQVWRGWLSDLFRFLKSKTAVEITNTFSTTSTSWTDVTGLTTTIGPSKRSSKFLITANLQVSGSAAHSMGFKIVKSIAGSETDVSVGDSAGNRVQVGAHVDGAIVADSLLTVTLIGIDEPNTTQLVTYKVKVINMAAGTLYINRTATDTNSTAFPRAVSTLAIEEIN